MVLQLANHSIVTPEGIMEVVMISTDFSLQISYFSSLRLSLLVTLSSLGDPGWTLSMLTSATELGI